MSTGPETPLPYFEWVDKTTWMLRNQGGETIVLLHNVHRDQQCAGTGCIIHSPSAHTMRDWPIFTRNNRPIERLCEHHIGHPDPDSLAFFQARIDPGGMWDLHGCDGCCTQARHNSPFRRLWMGIRYTPRTDSPLYDRINPPW